MRTSRRNRNDEGFSFAQVIVMMVIVGILGGAIGFTAFSLVGQSRETVLASNIRVAAETVRNTMALNPDLREGVDTTTGVPGAALMAELSNAAAFSWSDTWALNGSGLETVHVQALIKGTATEAKAAPEAPKVPWLVAHGDAIRLQIENDDGAWACALVVMRPDWAAPTGTANLSTVNARIEANLRGIWYDAGTQIDAAGLNACSPTIETVKAFSPTTAETAGGTGFNTAFRAPADYGNDDAGETNSTAAHKAPLPVSGVRWNVPGTTASTVADRTFERVVPDFDA